MGSQIVRGQLSVTIPSADIMIGSIVIWANFHISLNSKLSFTYLFLKNIFLLLFFFLSYHYYSAISISTFMHELFPFSEHCGGYKAYPENIAYYLQFDGTNWFKRPCPLGLGFDADKCACVIILSGQ